MQRSVNGKSYLLIAIKLLMKNKLYKIRNVPGRNNLPTEEGNRGLSVANSNHFPHQTLNPIAEAHTDHESQFDKLVSMFQTFIQTSEGRQTHAAKTYQVEARDREVTIPLPEIINNKIAPGELKAWTTSVVRTTCSSAFNYFFKKEMNYEQTKIYCSENIYKNIVMLSSRYALSAAQIELIDDHIKKGVLTYLAAKYPLTDSNEINKKLQAAIHEVDNIEAISNSYFTNSNVIFEYRDSGNYNDLIMMMLNDLMGLIDAENQDEVSNYQQFEEFMSTVFERVEDEEWMRKHDKEHIFNQLKLAHQQSEASPTQSEILDHVNREERAQLKERLRRQNEEKEKYKSKVKEYTHYLIGRKIPENTPTYSQIEIESGNMDIKSPTILRILTKWCGELHQKYAYNYYSNRSQSVKVQRGGNVNSLLAWMRRTIDNKLQAEMVQINKAMKDLFKNNYEMQTSIIQHELSLSGDEFIDHIERISGKLSHKVVKNLHTYIITYLNRLIHGLLKAAKDFFDEAGIFDYGLWPSPPNLLTFRIGDLMRCKCSSKQREILRIYKELQRISRQTPQKLKIIRIKNRLRSGTNDILMNVRFNDKITCEIQLGIKSKASDFIKCSNAFHHYLYQLQRSIFGPLTELCSIWNSLDRRADIYHSLVEEEQSAEAHLSPSQHTCSKLKKKFEMIPFDKPFLCNLCNRTYHHNNYVRQHVKCNLCGYFLCAYCRVDGETEEDVKNNLLLSPEMRQICKGRVGKGKDLPQFGICVFMQSKQAIGELYSLITYQKTKYLLGKRNGQIVEIYKVNSKKMMKKFRRKFILFEVESNDKFQKIDNKQAINKYILPQVMRINYKKEKESINLMDLGLRTQQCKEILQVGSRSQKETVKNLFLVDNQIQSVPFNPQDFPNIQWLTFSRNLMQSFEGIQLLQNLKNCICVSCQVAQIPPQFYDCSSLEHLSLPNNHITRIDDRVSNLKKILNLELSGNQLTELPESLFECTTLTTLKLDGNELTVIPESIRKLSNLEVIFFSTNQITQVPAAIGQLTKLREIYLAKNYSLGSLPDSFRNLTKIVMFDISSTQIATIPLADQGWPNIRLINVEATCISVIPAILLEGDKLQILIINYLSNFVFPQGGNYKALKALERNSAGANNFPDCMNKMTHLTTLKYEGNNLASLTSFPSLPSLQSLNISSCSLVTLPRLSALKKLKTLNLSSNYNISLPSEGIELPSLEEFTCNDSNLVHLSPCMLKWERLKKIDVGSNALTSLFDEETEARVKDERLGWPNLKFVTLGSNQLQEFPEAILNSLRVQDIRISSNQIKVIPASIKNLTHLWQIEMNYNQVEVLPPQFGQLPNMTNAYLSCNKFTVVPMFIKDMPKLAVFYMDMMEIKVVECEEWVLQVQGLTLGGLKDTAQRLKDERENPAAPEPNSPVEGTDPL